MRLSWSLLLFFCTSSVFSQTGEKTDDYFIAKPKVDSVAYSRDYQLAEGVYLKWVDFKENSPLGKEQIIIDYPKDQGDFWNQVVMKKNINYYDNSGVTKSIKTDQLWGFSINKRLYINTAEGFRKCILIGSLCYLDKVQDPLSNLPMLEREALESTSGAPQFASVPEKISVFDMETNISEDIDSGDLKLILAREPELLREYSALSYKRRKQTIMLYLRKYNEKHPLYLPLK